MLLVADADKRAYADYYELCMQLVRPGGIIALDNVFWYGKVADPEVRRPPQWINKLGTSVRCAALLLCSEHLQLG